jgi:UDP-N-acetylmuramate: L-alanyl-gamma-D-glutamyl-meso-diaminopimelate ligase
VELDHVDIYADYDAVKAAFRRFVALVPPEGSLAVCVEDEGAREVARGAAAALLPYGEGPGSVASPCDIDYAPDTTTFRIDTPDGPRGPFQMRLAGRHNVLNACGAFALWRHLGLDEAAFSAALASFSGVRRRLEPKGSVNGARVFEDFGHHPTEIRATLSALRQRHLGAILVAVFRAESNTSRTPLFEPRYVESLGLADRVDLAPTLAKRDYLKTARYFDPALVAAALAEAGTPATAHPDPDALVAALRAAAREDWVITIFSSRGMDGLAERLTVEG